LIHNLSLLLVDASVGTIQCLEEIVSPLGLLRIPQLQLEAVSCVGRSAQLHKDVGESLLSHSQLFVSLFVCCWFEAVVSLRSPGWPQTHSPVTASSLFTFRCVLQYPNLKRPVVWF
jgi:hypothetical protein